MISTKGSVLILIAGMTMGLAFGYLLWKPATIAPAAETLAPAIVQADSSVVLARDPLGKVAPPHQLPKGATIERTVSVTVQPRNGPAGTAAPKTVPPDSLSLSDGGIKWTDSSASVPKSSICPPVRVDLSLVRMPDQSHRVIASSPDGQVIGGVDVPAETPAVLRPTKWAVGPTYQLNAKSWGAFVDRDVGARLRVGVAAVQLDRTDRTRYDAQLRIGFRF